jgi:hypothetical protein
MELNPYQSPQEDGYEPPAIPDGAIFSIQRLFAFVLCAMVTVAAVWLLSRMLLW